MEPDRDGSGGGFEADLVAECLELVDVVAVSCVGCSCGRRSGPGRGRRSGPGVGGQVSDDDQDGAADGDDGLLLASAAGQPPVAFAEEGVGPDVAMAASPRTRAR